MDVTVPPAIHLFGVYLIIGTLVGLTARLVYVLAKRRPVGVVATVVYGVMGFYLGGYVALHSPLQLGQSAFGWAMWAHYVVVAMVLMWIHHHVLRTYGGKRRVGWQRRRRAH